MLSESPTQTHPAGPSQALRAWHARKANQRRRQGESYIRKYEKLYIQTAKLVHSEVCLCPETHIAVAGQTDLKQAAAATASLERARMAIRTLSHGVTAHESCKWRWCQLFILRKDLRTCKFMETKMRGTKKWARRASVDVTMAKQRCDKNAHISSCSYKTYIIRLLFVSCHQARISQQNNSAKLRTLNHKTRSA